MSDNAAMVALMEKWLADESGYDERVYPIVKARLEERDTLREQRDRLLEVARMGVKYDSEMAAATARIFGVQIARPKPSETAGNLRAAWVAATIAVVAEVEQADE